LAAGLGTAAAVVPVAPAFAFDTYSDTNLGYEFKYPSGVQKSDSKLFNVFLRDLIEPLDSIGVKLTDTKRKSLDDIGDNKAVAKLLMDDSIPPKAPKELISVTSKKDASGRRFDIVEWRYQWRFDPETAQQVGRQRFQLHQKAIITIDRKKQYVLIAGCEEERWSQFGDGALGSAVDTFKIIFD